MSFIQLQVIGNLQTHNQILSVSGYMKYYMRKLAKYDFSKCYDINSI